MNKSLKTILIISIAVFSAGVLLISPTNAQVDELVVEYSSDGGNSWLPFSDAIFKETNFLPGQNVMRLIRVTNNSEPAQRIAVEAINEINIGDLASQLDIVIKEGSNTIYSKTLKQFFNDGEIYLSSLAGLGGQTQYDFTVSFKSGADNDYQGKSVGFDLLVGFEGTEGGLTLPLPGGSAGGGLLPPGLTIQNETATTTTATSVTIIWTTSYLSTSQVIYAKEVEKHKLDLTDTAGTPPKYGYEYTTSEYDTPANTNGTTSHAVTITGLDSGTKHYYRAVSHGSLAISQEFSFTTLGEKVEEKTEEEIPSEEIGIPEIMKEIPKEITKEIKKIAEKLPAPEEVAPLEAGIVTVPPEEIVPGERLGSLLLASLGVIRETAWMMILAIFSFVGLIVIGIRERELAQKKKKSIS